MNSQHSINKTSTQMLNVFHLKVYKTAEKNLHFKKLILWNLSAKSFQSCKMCFAISALTHLTSPLRRKHEEKIFNYLEKEITQKKSLRSNTQV